MPNNEEEVPVFNLENITSRADLLSALTLGLAKVKDEVNINSYVGIIMKNPTLPALITKYLAPAKFISYEELRSLCSKKNLLDFLEIFMAYLNIKVYYDEHYSLMENMLHHTILTKEEERALIIRYKAGDQSAREELIAHNTLFIKSRAHIAYRRNPSLADVDDLFQYGVIGFMEALDKFDLSYNTRLTTYATYRVDHVIRINQERDNKTICPTRHMAEQKGFVYRVKNELTIKLNREPSINELAMATQKPVAFIKEILTKGDTVSLNAPVTEDLKMEDIIPDSYVLEDNVLKSNENNLIARGFSLLDSREQLILRLRLGFDKSAISQEETSYKLGLSRERVRQLETRALKKLKGFYDYVMEQEIRYISIHPVKMNFTDYFLGVSSLELLSYFSALEPSEINLLASLYTADLKLKRRPTKEELTVLETEIVPYLFHYIFELNNKQKPLPFISLFEKKYLPRLMDYISRENLTCLIKRYGVCLNEVNPLTKEEYRHLYTTEIPKLYNYYQDLVIICGVHQKDFTIPKISIKKHKSQKGEAWAPSLQAKYPDLSLEELKNFVSLLIPKHQNVIYTVYGENLDQSRTCPPSLRISLNSALRRIGTLIDASPKDTPELPIKPATLTRER